MEGNATVLIEGGRIKRKQLAKELITLPQLESAAHKQGFAALDEVQRAPEFGDTVVLESL